MLCSTVTVSQGHLAEDIHARDLDGERSEIDLCRISVRRLGNFSDSVTAEDKSCTIRVRVSHNHREKKMLIRSILVALTVLSISTSVRGQGYPFGSRQGSYDPLAQHRSDLEKMMLGNNAGNGMRRSDLARTNSSKLAPLTALLR